MTDPASIPDAVAAAWRACEECWDDAGTHDAFFTLVSQHGCFAWAAGRYRARAGDATADRMLDRIRRAATATLMATATTREPGRGKPYQMTILMIMLMLAAIGGLVYVANLRHGGSPPGEAR